MKAGSARHRSAEVRLVGPEAGPVRYRLVELVLAAQLKAPLVVARVFRMAFLVSAAQSKAPQVVARAFLRAFQWIGLFVQQHR